MQGEIPAAAEKLISILNKCRQDKNLHHATSLHAYMREQALETHPVLGNYLVPMLVECGGLPVAQQVFDKLTYKNEHSWTSLISAYTNHGEPQKAFHLYSKMQEEGCVQSNKHAYVALLNACDRLKDSEKGQVLHAEITRRGFERDVSFGSAVMGNTLIDMYGKCGLLEEAQHVFDRLPVRTAVSWNALIAGYTECGLGEKAGMCVQRMQSEGVAPDLVTFICSLKACGTARALETGREMHAEVTSRNLERELYLCSTLIDMYLKCGSFVEAHRVFHRLELRDTVLWNALIAIYSDYGFGEEVLNSLLLMHLEGSSPDSVTYIFCIQACGIIRALETGQELYGELTKRGWERELHVANTLVDMYTKCSSLAEAQDVLNRLRLRDVVSWDALVAGYAEHGLGEAAGICFWKMQAEGILPDANTFACSLKAFAASEALEKGQELHAETTKRGLERDLYVGSALVDMYAKCSLFAEADHVFWRMPVRNAVSWNALIAGYSECGLGKESLKCFQQMQLDGIAPDSHTFVCSLNGCGTIGDPKTGQEIHTQLTKIGLERELYVGNAMIDMYTKCSLLAEARAVFDWLTVQDAVSWTSLIAGYSEHSLEKEVLDCFKRMQFEGMLVDAVTYVICLKACSTLGAIEIGHEIHHEVSKFGLEYDLSVGSMLIDMYGKCGSIGDAREVFDKLPSQDVVAWTAMIKAYGENHDGEMVKQCFEHMQQQGVEPDSVTFICALAACSQASSVPLGEEYFKKMQNEHNMKPTLDHYACMIDLLARSGFLTEAERVVAAIEYPPSSVILMALLNACKQYGKVQLAQTCFQQLLEANQEDASAYLLLTDVYASAGRWNDANRVEEMRKYAEAKKMPGSASIEVNRELHGFVVGVDQSKDAPTFLEFLYACTKYEGYVPDLDSMSNYVSEEKREMPHGFADIYSLCLTCHKANTFSTQLSVRSSST